MVTLPEEFVATKYPGYFWNTKEQRLYSLKVDGVLKPLAITTPNHWNNLPDRAYRISVEGRKRYMLLSKLKELTPGVDSTIPTRSK